MTHEWCHFNVLSFKTMKIYSKTICNLGAKLPYCLQRKKKRVDKQYVIQNIFHFDYIVSLNLEFKKNQPIEA